MIRVDLGVSGIFHEVAFCEVSTTPLPWRWGKERDARGRGLLLSQEVAEWLDLYTSGWRFHYEVKERAGSQLYWIGAVMWLRDEIDAAAFIMRWL